MGDFATARDQIQAVIDDLSGSVCAPEQQPQCDAILGLLIRARAALAKLSPVGLQPTHSTPSVATTAAASSAVSPTKLLDRPYFGMGLPEAVWKRLSILPPKTPQSQGDIWHALEAAGFVSNHNDPTSAVRNALAKRAKARQDVICVGRGLWGLKSWYTDQELSNIEATRGGTPTRVKPDHIEKTKRGMQLARERGTRFGPKPRVTDEFIDNFSMMMLDGFTAEEACEKTGISIYTYRRYKERFSQNLEAKRVERPNLRVVGS